MRHFSRLMRWLGIAALWLAVSMIAYLQVAQLRLYGWELAWTMGFSLVDLVGYALLLVPGLLCLWVADLTRPHYHGPRLLLATPPPAAGF